MLKALKPGRVLALTTTLIALSLTPAAQGSVVFAEFDVTNAVSSTTTPIAVANPTPEVLTSPLIPVNVNFNGVSAPGLYWDASWTTSSIPNSLSQRLFFNVIPDPGMTLTFDKLTFYVSSGNSTPVGVELRVFGAGSTLAAPQYIATAMVLSTNFAAPVVADVSSLVPLLNDNYQFSLTFFSRNINHRVGLTGNLPADGAPGGNMILTGLISNVPESRAWLMLGVVAWGAIGALFRKRARALAALAIAFGVAGSAEVQATVVHNVIAASGTAAPAGGNYVSFSSVRLNLSGQVAYIANLTGGSSTQGIYRGNGTTTATIARQATAAPAGGNYSSFSSPQLNASGQVVYWADLTGGSSTEGFFRGDGTTAVTIARTGTAAPSGGNYSDFPGGVSQMNVGGQVAFRADLTGGASTGGIFRGNGTTTTIARTGIAAPAGGNYSMLFGGQQINAAGQVAYVANLTGGSSNGGVFRGDGATATTIARQATAAPAGGNFDGFGSIQLNASGQVAFFATLAGGSSSQGIFRGDGTTAVTIARIGTAAPAGGNYSGFSSSPQLNASGQVAYFSGLTGGLSTSGIFRGDGTTQTAIALGETLAPGTTGTFAMFSTTPLLNDAGLVVLRATLTLGGSVTASNDTGLWFGTNSSNLMLLAREGDTLLVNSVNRTLGNVTSGSALTDTGVTWTASFTDGTSAVMYSTFTAVPEARAWLMVGVVCVGACGALLVKRGWA